jgi:hypothetical protein
MQRWLATALLFGAVVAWSVLPGARLAQANTLPGNRIQLTGAEDAGSTFMHIITQYGVPLMGTAAGLGGAAMLGSRPTIGLLTLSGGGMMIFWPSVVQSGASYVLASTGVSLAGPVAPALGWLIGWLAIAPSVIVATSVLFWQRVRGRKEP